MHDAQKRIKSTLEWRREYKPELIPPDEVSEGYVTLLIREHTTLSQVKMECETGKMCAPL